MATLLLSLTLVVLGCQKEPPSGEPQARADSGKKKADPVKKSDPDGAKEDDEYEHDWWCGVHGIPEDECGKCNKDLQKKAKANGDWCETHKRIKSQCFACDPTLYDRVFEPKYVAKYGKKPKRPPEKEFK
jgi:hypothetical protein